MLRFYSPPAKEASTGAGEHGGGVTSCSTTALIHSTLQRLFFCSQPASQMCSPAEGSHTPSYLTSQVGTLPTYFPMAGQTNCTELLACVVTILTVLPLESFYCLARSVLIGSCSALCK